VGYLVCSVSAGFLGSSPHFYALFGLAAAAHRLGARTVIRAGSTPLGPGPREPDGGWGALAPARVRSG
jgi:hypothetical protein